MTDHKQWLDNEYSQWIKALQESTVHNFKEHPGVRRMLGDVPDMRDWLLRIDGLKGLYNGIDWMPLKKINLIGYNPDTEIKNANHLRMLYYALQILARNPSSICEIGGGVGQFYAILRALGWKGEYWIEDLPEVKQFQKQYLKEVSNQTGLSLDQWMPIGVNNKFDMLVSFYALGEFDNETKQKYEKVIDNAEHGYIAFNPHSGASDSLSIFENHDIKVTPGIEPGISIIEW